jgi:hypothetical protein
MKILSLFFILIFSTPVLFAKTGPVPDFGSSVEFPPEYQGLSLDKMRGKGVLIIFFQSWCGICNKWAPEMFPQAQKTLDKYPNLIRIAIKTDGGTLKEASSFLSHKKADPNSWIIGIDKGANYYKQVTGSNGLWNFVLIGPKGDILESKSAGAYFKSKNGQPKTYVLAKMNYGSLLGNEVNSTIKNKYPEPFNKAVQQAEIGSFLNALKESKKLSRNSKYKADSENFDKELMGTLQEKVETHSSTLEDEESNRRFEAYMSLRTLCEDLKKLPIGKDASKLLRKYKFNKSIAKELKAETAYLKLMAKVQKLTQDKKASYLKKYLPKIIKSYSGTHFAGIANTQLGSI